jgi:hypothetical protein
MPCDCDPLQGSRLLENMIRFTDDDVLYQMEKNLNLSPADAQLLFDDTKKFLFLCRSNPDQRMSPPRKVDKGWHEFILCMNIYEEFCMENFQEMIYHRPSPRGAAGDDGESLRKTRELAVATFGELSANWDISKVAVRSADYTREPDDREGWEGGSDCQSCRG